jgi:hypothetical protein
MNRDEFCKATGLKYESIDEDDWNTIQTVYNFHPMISDTKGKNEIAALYKKGGMGLLTDMFGTADEISCRESNIQLASVEMEKIQKKFDADLKELNAKYENEFWQMNEKIRSNRNTIINLINKYEV